MPRRFGPVQAAGTVVEEKEAGKTIVPSTLGTTAYVGVVEKGAPGEIIDCPTQREFLKKCGTYLDGSELPDNALDFYNLSQGAGRLYVVRVTDGNEVSAGDTVLGREPGTGEYVNRTTGDEQKTTMLTVAAKNGGRWGGAERVLSKDYTIATDLTETTLDLGETMLEDEYKGATLTLFGVTARSYEVVSNTTAGVLTVAADATMASDLAAGGDATNNAAQLVLDAETRAFTAPGSVAGDRKALSLLWKDGEEDAAAYFGLDVLVDGAIVRTYENLSLDSTDKWYIDNVVNNDPDNEWIEVTVVHTGSFTAANRPANWFGEYRAFAGATLTAEIAHVRSVVPNTPGNDLGFVTDWLYRAKTARQQLVLTFSNATTFAVTTTASRGAEHLSLPDGTVGTPYATTLAADDKTLLDTVPTFTVQTGVDAFEAGDVITIDIEPFPVGQSSGNGLLSGLVWVDGDDANSERLQIEDNTVNTITLKNSPTVAPTPASDIASVPISTGAITFPTTGGTLTINSDITGVDATFVYAAEANMTALVATLNGFLAAAGLPASLFTDGGGDLLSIALPTVYAPASSNEGEDQFFEIISDSGAELNLTPAVYTGTRGDNFRVQAPRELRDGYDGAAPADSDYTNAYNTATSPLNRLKGRGLGLVKLATPGVTTTAIQKAGIAYAAFRNYQYRVEAPTSVTSETSAVAYYENTIGRSTYAVTTWPSSAKVSNPVGSGLVTQTLTGAIHGDEAANARNFQGFHKALDVESGKLPHVIESILGEVEVNEEILNPKGIGTIKKIKGNWTVWGDRTLASDTAWKWKHKREYASHIEATLLESFDFVTFSLNDPANQETLIPVFEDFFRPEFLKRALTAESGKFEDAFSVKIDNENNTPATRNAGDLHADVSMRIVDTTERFIISVSQAGIFEA